MSRPLALSPRSGRSFATWLGLALLMIVPFAAPTMAKAAVLDCEARTGAVNFATYSPTALLDKASDGYVEVKCGCTGLGCIAFSYSIELQAGQGTESDRRLRRSGQTSGGIKYKLCQDVLCAIAFGTGSSKATVGQLLSGLGLWNRTTVFGVIPAGQAVASGAYSDDVGVIITY